MMSHTLSEVTRYSIYVASVAAVLFPLLYSQVAWRASAVGRALMTHSVAIGLILLIATLSLLHAITSVKPWINAVLYLFLAFALWYQLLTFAWIQFKARRAKRKMKTPPSS